MWLIGIVAVINLFLLAGQASASTDCKPSNLWKSTSNANCFNAFNNFKSCDNSVVCRWHDGFNDCRAKGSSIIEGDVIAKCQSLNSVQECEAAEAWPGARLCVWTGAGAGPAPGPAPEATKPPVCDALIGGSAPAYAGPYCNALTQAECGAANTKKIPCAWVQGCALGANPDPSSYTFDPNTNQTQCGANPSYPAKWVQICQYQGSQIHRSSCSSITVENSCNQMQLGGLQLCHWDTSGIYNDTVPNYNAPAAPAPGAIPALPSQPTGPASAPTTSTAPVASTITSDYLVNRYPVPENYDGPLPPCAFSGTCRSTTDLITLLLKGAKFLFSIIGVVAFAAFVYGGFMMIFSFGSSEKVGHGKDAMVAAVVGLVIAFGAYLIINFVLNALGVAADFRGIIDT